MKIGTHECMTDWII